MIQLAKKIFLAGHSPVWNCGTDTSKTRWRHWRKHWHVWRIPAGVGIWFHSLSLPTFVVAKAFSIAGAKILQNMWAGPSWAGVWPYLDPWDVVRLRTSSCFLERPEEVRAARRALFLPHQVGALRPYKGSGVQAHRSCGACSLIGLHLMAAEIHPDQAVVSPGDTVAQKVKIETVTANHCPKVKAFTMWKALLCMLSG